MIQVGSLVRSRNNNLGIGKVTQISEQSVVVEYFCSLGKQIQNTLPLISLSQVRIQRQTRCYIKLENEDRWGIGRIFTWDEDNDLYQVDLPDKKTVLVTEQEVYVRCDLPIEDPIDILAMKGQETPYFHERRLALVNCLMSQRAVSRGMTGLLSANIKLYPHQVEVIRRVLEDPIQRYLLADDEGLGKTIEAGAILRQYLLDESQGTALVVVPKYLLEQWHQELENKFYISHFPDRVKVVAVEDVQKINRNADINFVIFDEADKIAAMAYSFDASQRQRFAVYKHIAHKCDRLLLLTATPLLNHERDYLAMLHLLEPDIYRMDDLALFRAKVQNRAAIGKILLSLEDADSVVLKDNLNQLRTLFPKDAYLLDLADKLETKTATDQDKIIREIRTHISDTHRLHRRILRNRPASVEDVIWERNISPKAEYDLDERSIDIHESIEKWRSLAPNEKEYQRIFLLLFLASGTWLGLLEQVITARLKNVARKELIQDFDEESINTLTDTPKFAGEEEILESLLKIVRQPSEDGDRIELLKTVLLYHLSERFNLQSYRSNLSKLLEQVQRRITRPIPGDTLPKIVVFTSFPQVGAEIVRCLRNSFGKAIATHQLGQTSAEVEKNLKQFKNDSKCFILVCDSAGEEGRSLQFADWIIHFDIPWSPNRLEKRISRIDSIYNTQKIELTVFAGADLEDSPHDAWYRLLKEGLAVFHRSITSLEFYVDKKLPQLEAKLFETGANGLIEILQQIQDEIAAEKIKLSQQNVLDEIDIFDEDAIQYFTALDNYDAQYQEIQRSVEQWICDALEFKQVYKTDFTGIQRYQPTMRTLVPVDELRTYFNTFAETFGTFNRKLANQNSDINLYRIGEEFIESLASYIHWDDRGQAFALWRFDKSWDNSEGKEWFGFRFNYIIEANLTYLKDDTKYQILKRRADGLFPPLIESIFVDVERMSVVQDEELLTILQRPYKGKGGTQYRDYNLAKSRLSIIDSFVEANKWQYFCYQARQTSLELLEQRPDFVKLCEKQATIAEQKLNKRVEQLELRLNQLVENKERSDSELAEEIETETDLIQLITEGIRHPSIRLDSVGFIVVSGHPPTQSEEEGDNS
ncbi:DEAD/DEAH box helicase [Hassallia byssoidea VB512170]|uniref:DEAD/DEAH box helicase n=1 Tax=Hassallia byssoidea VB512170 TaxID=1304833 RepID=A0A846H1Y0_9CYAN|nr:protein DpdE [Hassalia byssoidea]NEU71546.1 DEAD/DEAH box helicase [Hassalia byssoidea VB512170]